MHVHERASGPGPGPGGPVVVGEPSPAPGPTDPPAPDPATRAGELPDESATSMADATVFLYTGADPIQKGVAPGTITVKRAYGDWTNPRLSGWREQLLGNAISPQQQFAYTVGKNATDSALIIDAMDLLYSGNVEGFAIVSSDSDFTPLATRLRGLLAGD